VYRLKRFVLATAALVLASLACNVFTPDSSPEPTRVQVVIVAPYGTPVPTLPVTVAAPQATQLTATPGASGPVPTPTITLTPTPTIPTATPPPSLTPSITFTPSQTPLPQPIPAKLRKGTAAWMRETPGTAGKKLRWLENEAAFNIIGRTQDGSWAQVTMTKDGKQGWVSTQYIDLQGGNLASLLISGVAIEASATPTYAVGAPSVISGITARSREIFLKGKSLGNRPYVFTRVGDSITATPFFLTPIGVGNYNLGDYYNQLIDVVEYFSQIGPRGGNSFSGESLAAGNGWGADRIIQPGYAHADQCGAESPLVCEYRRAKPSVALIMIGTNDSGGVSPGAYAANLRRIVDISIDMGVIPVLSTIPPKQNDLNAARAEDWNSIIRRLAREYDIPLLDFWFALQKAPNRGMAADGIHPSAPPSGATCVFTADFLKYGFNIRNLTALQMLDALWHQVLY
jgi:hypothetical protein